MKKQIYKLLSVLLVAVFVLSAIPLYSTADDGTDEIPSENVVLQEYDGETGEGEEVENELSFYEGDPESNEIEEEEILNNLHITNGLPETAEVEETEGELEAGSGESAAKPIEDFVFDGDTNEESAENHGGVRRDAQAESGVAPRNDRDR